MSTKDISQFSWQLSVAEPIATEQKAIKRNVIYNRLVKCIVPAVRSKHQGPPTINVITARIEQTVKPPVHAIGSRLLISLQ